jgi:Cu/Zn superoxide dismutase
VSNGPGISAGPESQSISCANIFNPTVATTSDQDVQATLLNASGPNQNVTGTANLSVDNKQLTVTMSLKGLAPNSKHIAHIHVGSCASQGQVIHDLNPIIADANGNANSTTVISKVDAIPRNGWYVNIHLGDSEKALKSQTGFDPIACGDITQIH